jgi:DnaK suppressor protein
MKPQHCYNLFLEKKGHYVTNDTIKLQKIREELIKKKQELERNLTELSFERTTDNQVQDPGDQALSSTLELLRSSLQNTETAEYHSIERALEKIDDGSYGVCIDCSLTISEKRLTLFPDAVRCLSCQELFEDKP